jgi:hypothetical protein
MSTAPQYAFQPSPDKPHVAWIELYGDQTLHEVAVMKKNQDGSLLFIRINDLDQIDRRRLVNILQDRNVRNFELFDLMSQRTLGNGVNALAYFHQLVKVIHVNGKVTDLKSGQVGVSGTMKMPQPAPPVQPPPVTTK